MKRHQVSKKWRYGLVRDSETDTYIGSLRQNMILAQRKAVMPAI